jgi:hypothetical protein
MNHIHQGSFLIENSADAFQFSGLRMIDSRIHQRQLFFTLFAHFAAAPFFLICSNIDFLDTFNACL